MDEEDILCFPTPQASTVALLAHQSSPVSKVIGSGMIFLGCQGLMVKQ